MREDDRPSELWMPVPESQLEVSDLGRVRSRAWGRLRAIRPYPNGRGYLQVGWRVGGRRRSALVHRLVLAAFAGPCPPGHEARHLDGNPGNNARTNLCWGTHAENMLDTLVHGRRRGLTPKQVGAVRLLLKAGWPQRKIAKHFGVSSVAICYINRGRTHRLD